MKIDGVEFRRHPIFIDYYANRNGNIYSSLSSRILSGKSTNGNGYLQVYLTMNGKSHKYYIHRFVWECWNGIIASDKEIDHCNSDRSDNRLENLRLVTRRGNSFNRITTRSREVETLPRDAIEIEKIKRHEYENYYYSESEDSVYLRNREDGEIMKLHPTAGNRIFMTDVNGKNHLNSLSKIREEISHD